MGTIHLICGLPCSGKTTFSKSLADSTKSLYLGLDQILIAVHGQYSIAAIGPDLHRERVIAARRALWNVVESAVSVGMDVVLDDGFFLKETRIRYAKLCRDLKVSSRIHYLEVPLEVLKVRLNARNNALPSQNFLIGIETLLSMHEMFEAPVAEEGNALEVVRPNGDPHSNLK